MSDMAIPEKVLMVQELVKSFPDGQLDVAAVRGVSFEANRGEFVAITGPSGCGKTTLLTMLGCILMPTSGSINILGIDIGTLHADVLHIIRAKFIGFIFQTFNLFPQLTALENVMLSFQIKGGTTRRKMKSEAIDLLTRFGLQDRLHFHPAKLSGGQKQRVAIARAMVLGPPLILADEPTGNLDQASAREVLTLLQDLAHSYQKTVLIVTHDPLIRDWVDRVLHFKEGIIDYVTKKEP